MAHRLVPRLALLMAGAVLSGPSLAATATGTLAVTATVLDTCTVATTPLAFGTISSSATTFELTPALITVTCTAAHATATLSVDGGANASGGTRRMSNALGGFVPYSIYSNSGHSSAVAIGGQLYSGALTAITPTVVSVYGSVAPSTYEAGVYADAAVVTLVYN